MPGNASLDVSGGKTLKVSGDVPGSTGTDKTPAWGRQKSPGGILTEPAGYAKLVTSLNALTGNSRNIGGRQRAAGWWEAVSEEFRTRL